MRDVPIPPPWLDQLPSVIMLAGQPDLQRRIASINRKYLHWDKVRYQPRPAGATAEQLWSLVKLSRSEPRFNLPLADIHGQPFSYTLPVATQPVLHEVDRGGGSILGIDETTQNQSESLRKRVLISTLMEEAIATSQIEGAVTTRKVAKEMLQTNRQPRNRSEQMIVNGYRTVQMLRDRIGQPLDYELLFEIQSSMTRDTLDDPTCAGRFRTAHERITIVDSRDGETVFTPPPADDLPNRIEMMFKFTNSEADENEFIHPLVKAAILHFWLAYEHPFVDGNGRTARALFYWWMLKSGYWLFEYLTISRAILEAPIQYHHSFQFSETDENDLTYSIMFMLRITHKAITKMREYLRLKQDEQTRFAALLRNMKGLNGRQREHVQAVLSDPTTEQTFNSYRQQYAVSLLTARSDLLDLVRRGVLKKLRSGRQHRFVAAPEFVKRMRPKST